MTAFGQQQVAIYVSPSGNDHNTGSIEKPFATLEKAKQIVRKKSGIQIRTPARLQFILEKENII